MAVHDGLCFSILALLMKHKCMVVYSRERQSTDMSCRVRSVLSVVYL